MLKQKDGAWWVEDSDGLRRATDLEVELWVSLQRARHAIELMHSILEDPRFDEGRNMARARMLDFHQRLVAELVGALDEAFEAGMSDVYTQQRIGDARPSPVVVYECTRRLRHWHRKAKQMCDVETIDELMGVLKTDHN